MISIVLLVHLALRYAADSIKVIHRAIHLGGDSVTAIENEPQLFSACADWPVQFKPGTKRKPSVGLAKAKPEVIAATSVPIVAKTAEIIRPAPRSSPQWAGIVKRAFSRLIGYLSWYIGEVCNETARRIGVGLLLLLLAWLGFKNLDYQMPPEPQPSVVFEHLNDDWTTIVKPEPKRLNPR